MPKLRYAAGLTSYLCGKQGKIFDYPKFAEPIRDRLRENAERLAAEAGAKIQFIRKRSVRKEDLVSAALAKRGDPPGVECILSAIEPCSTYKPWHDKATGKTFLRPDEGECSHYYFYFIDAELGVCYTRVPAWLPCRLRIYCNGHNWRAGKLRQPKIDYQLMDDAFVAIGDWKCAQSSWPADWRSNGWLASWTSSRKLTARSIAILEWCTTGAPINASTPPTSFSSGRRIWRRSMAL